MGSADEAWTTTFATMTAMFMHACPHCGGPGITTFRKYLLGPALPAPCRSCGRKIAVPPASLLTLVPLLLGVLASRSVPCAWVPHTLAAAAASMLLSWWFVPLVSAGPPSGT